MRRREFFTKSFNIHLQKPQGILAVLDEQSRFPKATDQSLATKLHDGPGRTFSKRYLAPKDRGTTFAVLHYAGHVVYQLDGVLEKNKETLPASILFTMKSKPLFSGILHWDLTTTEIYYGCFILTLIRRTVFNCKKPNQLLIDHICMNGEMHNIWKNLISNRPPPPHNHTHTPIHIPPLTTSLLNLSCHAWYLPAALLHI